jgi:hypothetical protein
MPIRLTYGLEQRFRHRTRDLTFPGRVDGLALPARRAEWRLNGAVPVPFYVEAITDDGVDWVTGYKDSPAELRCKELGDFVIEVPVAGTPLAAGENTLAITVEDAAGRTATATVAFSWDPEPVPLGLDLADLSQVGDVQEIGQGVSGAFEVIRARNVIRSRAPVAPDALLVLGAPHASQEATYTVRFTGFAGVKWLGPSDFFAGFEDKEPAIGVKTGWSSAGMMALNPAGEARCFLSWGDHSNTAREWVVCAPPARVDIAPSVPYRVRHQVLFEGGVNRCRFRIWPAGGREPEGWLCEESDAGIAPHLPRHRAASFALFQHSGAAIEWSEIRVRRL